MARLLIYERYTGCWIYFNEPEYASIMPQYAWICFNNTAYYWIYQHIPEKKQSAEYATILNVSDAVHSKRSMYKLLNYWEDIETEAYSEHCQTFKMEWLAKRIMADCSCANKNISWERPGEGGLWN